MWDLKVKHFDLLQALGLCVGPELSDLMDRQDDGEAAQDLVPHARSELVDEAERGRGPEHGVAAQHQVVVAQPTDRAERPEQVKVRDA